MPRPSANASGTAKPYQRKKLSINKTVGPSDVPVRFAAMQETGFNGARVYAGISYQELRSELQFPTSIITYKQMSYHSAVNAALRLYEYIASKCKFRVVPPKNPTDDERQKAEILNDMIEDMDHSFYDVVTSALSFNIFGFSILEKVYKRRPDGIIAWKRLPIRSQETVAGFKFTPEGNDVTGVKQYVPIAPNGTAARYVQQGGNAVVIPRSKFLLFTTGSTLDPYGKSPLRDAYLAWRYLSAIEEMEASGIARDLAGVPLIRLPAQMMAPDASTEQKNNYLYWQNVVRNVHQGSQTGIIMPSTIDPDTRQPLFNFELVSNTSKKLFDTTAIKDYYKNQIFTTMFADILTLGQGSSGSYALADKKGSLAVQAVEAMLTNILNVLNRDLIRQTYDLNGWDVKPGRWCKFDMEGSDDLDLDVFASAVQRTGATGYLPKTLDVVNTVLEKLGIDRLPENLTQEELDKILPDKTTRSGDGMQEGLSNGTGDSTGASGDASVSNLAN